MVLRFEWLNGQSFLKTLAIHHQPAGIGDFISSRPSTFQGMWMVSQNIQTNDSENLFKFDGEPFYEYPFAVSETNQKLAFARKNGYGRSSVKYTIDIFNFFGQKLTSFELPHFYSDNRVTDEFVHSLIRNFSFAPTQPFILICIYPEKSILVLDLNGNEAMELSEKGKAWWVDDETLLVWETQSNQVSKIDRKSGTKTEIGKTTFEPEGLNLQTYMLYKFSNNAQIQYSLTDQNETTIALNLLTPSDQKRKLNKEGTQLLKQDSYNGELQLFLLSDGKL